MTTGKRHPRLADNPGTMHVKTCIAPDKDEKEIP
ncbi:unknown [Prevotella sp. CAG:592]|nr:unknown [Prevotella sp. CAG:592]